MKTIAKYFMMVIAMVAMSVNLSSCEKEDSITGLNDYYVECNVSGGGLNSSEISALKSLLNLEFSELSLEAMDKDGAIYVFDRLVKELKNQFSVGLEVDETLKITLVLKTTEGKTVKQSVLKITQNGCTIA